MNRLWQIGITPSVPATTAVGRARLSEPALENELASSAAVSLWFGSLRELVEIEPATRHARELCGKGKPFYLGLHLVDPETGAELSEERMRFQLGKARKLILDGTVDGVLVADCNRVPESSAALRVLREWIAANADLEPSPGRDGQLPGEADGPDPLGPFPFPDRISAYVWRNWGIVPVARLADVVGAQPEDLRRIAAEMGLPSDPPILGAWLEKGYITVIRRNWHLLDYDQIMQLTGFSRERLHFILTEEDFLYSKLGSLKPKCGKLMWRSGDVEKWRSARQRIARILREEGASDFSEEPRFSFIKELSAPAQSPNRTIRTIEQSNNSSSRFDIRLGFSYFADYGDPLVDPKIGSYPEGLLDRLAANGVNAVWLHVVLRTLAKDPAFPEFGEGSEARIANLRTLVARAAARGIRIFLYLNEPRPMPAEFFERRPERAGMKGNYIQWNGLWTMCTSAPETLRWMGNAVERVFREVPGLGGIFTISASETMTHCDAHNLKRWCRRCKTRRTEDLVAEVNRTLIEGMRRAAPEAVAVVWNWGWQIYRDHDITEEVLSSLPRRNVRFMCNSEAQMPIWRGGVELKVGEYAISAVGPGMYATERWRLARRLGFGTMAKVQADCTWELAAFPYLPLVDLVAEHAVNLAASEVDGVMLAWSLGGAPATNLAVWSEVRADDTKDALLDRLAAQAYGAANVARTREAWRSFAEGFREYPFCVRTLHHGPQQMGPANLLYPSRTGFKATMCGIPYDDLDTWRGEYPAETWSAQMRKVADGFAAGCRLLEGIAPRKELDMFRAEALHFRSIANQADWVIRRDRAALRDELRVAKAYLPLIAADSRIGYECSNHYFATPRDVREKIIACRLLSEIETGRDI